VVGLDAPESANATASAAAPAGDAAVVTTEPLADAAPATTNPDAADLATDTPAANAAASAPPASTAMFPAPTAGGDYAVHFGSFSTLAAADRVVAQLRGSQLPGYREAATVDGRRLQRVRIGPYATRAEAESARLRAAHVRDDVGARVVALDAVDDAPAPSTPATTTASATPKPVAPAPKPAASTPAASSTGFAVQVGAFSKPGDATALRDRLRAAGFSAFTETVSTDKGALTRVRVGPVLARAEADQLQQQVRSKLGLDGIVRPHP
jgi:cell division septation protein DedD